MSGPEMIQAVSEWLASCWTALWSAFGTWGIIGFAIIGLSVIQRLANLFKKIFNF